MIPQRKLVRELTPILDDAGCPRPLRVAQEIAEKIIPMFTPQLAKVASHPLRQGAVTLLADADGPLSPVMMAPKLNATLGTMAYHIRYLEEQGVIELVRTEQRRGAMEHFYRLKGDE